MILRVLQNVTPHATLATQLIQLPKHVRVSISKYYFNIDLLNAHYLVEQLDDKLEWYVYIQDNVDMQEAVNIENTSIYAEWMEPL